MREPNIKELVERLSSESYAEDVFDYGQDADAAITQLMYFMRKEQVPTLYKEISELPEEKKDRVFASLAKIYPLSREIVIHLLRKWEKKPLDFLLAYDMEYQLLNELNSTLTLIKENSSATQTPYNNYLKEIDKINRELQQLNKEIAEFNNVSEDIRKRREEKQMLQDELRQLNEESQDNNLDIEIENLEKDIQEHRQKETEKSEKHQKLEKELSDIQQSLQEREKIAMKNYKNALAALEKCIKSLHEKE